MRRMAQQTGTAVAYLNRSMMRMEGMLLRLFFRTPPVVTRTGPVRLNPIRGVVGQRCWRWRRRKVSASSCNVGETRVRCSAGVRMDTQCDADSMWMTR